MKPLDRLRQQYLETKRRNLEDIILIRKENDNTIRK